MDLAHPANRTGRRQIRSTFGEFFQCWYCPSFSLPWPRRASLRSPFRPRSPAAEPDPPVVRVVSREYSFEAPDRVPAGAVTFHLFNEGAEPHHAWFVRFDEGHDLADYMEAVHAGRGHTPEWAVDMGGPMVMMAPGAVSNATIDMEPGRYAIVCHVPSPDGESHLAKGMAKEFVVEASSAPREPMPEADLTIDLVDYAFVIEKPLHPGSQWVQFTNTSGQTHELVLWRLGDGAHVDDLIAWVERMDGPPPGEVVGGVSGIAPGVENLVKLDLEAGRYAATCFVPDTGDGAPHTDHGMKAEFEVM
jgi:uncharacterized cupredoxin-like copper-binding protein